MDFTDYDPEQLKHLQGLELMILKDFIKICDENNLKYYIYGGSLLGAVRHKGFIPWDDDIDVIMFRDDYEKFKKIFLSKPNEKYELLTYETYDDDFFLFSKIMLKGTKFEEWWVDQVSFSEGINMDIFVLDNVSDNDFKCSIQTKKARLCDRLLSVVLIKVYDYPFPIRHVSNFTHAIFKLFKVKPDTFRKRAIKTLTKYDNTTKRVCDISALHRPQIYNREYFGKGKKIQFEDIQVNAPENSHKILEQIYGDYMQLPPEDKRYNHFTEELDFGPYKP